MKSYKFIDSVLVDQPTESSIRSDVTGIVNAGKQTKLKVSIDATHSGVITNRRVYPGNKVQKGYKTFFSKESGGDAEYNKPVLKHHSMYDDPIGRIVKAMFTPLKSGYDFENDYMNPDAEGGRGSGVVTLDAVISDPDAIQKIIDGRYLSISVGHSTDTVTCSICSDNIFRCDHIPGVKYTEEGEEARDADEDTRLCYYITGNMTYNEASFVNLPAQAPAKLINFSWEDCDKIAELRKDNILIESMTRGKKALVRALSLQDEDGEYNLLKGTSTSAKKKLIMDMTGPKNPNSDYSESEETSKVLQSTSATSKKDVLADSDNSDKKSKLKEANNMDVKDKADTKLDASVLSASLEALTKEREKMQQDLAAASTKVTGLEKTIETKNSEIDRLTKAQTDMQVEMSKALATALASVRVQLRKPDSIGLDSADKFTEYSDKLSKRSVESLRDSLADLILELSNQKVDEKVQDGKGIKDIVADSKVITPGVQNDKNKVLAGVPKGTKTTDNKKPLDRAFGE